MRTAITHYQKLLVRLIDTMRDQNDSGYLAKCINITVKHFNAASILGTLHFVSRLEHWEYLYTHKCVCGHNISPDSNVLNYVVGSFSQKSLAH